MTHPIQLKANESFFGNFETDFITLGERMKLYESKHQHEIAPNESFLIRLDGKCFSKFTKGFRKPFDCIFQSVMIKVMNEMVKEFCATTGYTHSDEITLIFPAVCTAEEFEKNLNKSAHLFDGRVNKLISVTASYCSVRFNANMRALMSIESNKDLFDEKFIEKLTSDTAIFDSRLVSFPVGSPEEIVNHMIWRSNRDCFRNAVSSYAREYFTNTELNNKTCTEMIKMMQEEKSFDFYNDAPMMYQHGVYAKRELINKVVMYNSQEKIVSRQQITNKSFIIKFTQEFYKLMVDKNWTDIVKQCDEKENNTILTKTFKTEFYNVHLKEDGQIDILKC